MLLGYILAQQGGVVEGLKQTGTEIGQKFGFDTQLFLSQVIGFVIVAFLLQKFAFKPIQRLLEQRRKVIADSLANAEKIKAELQRTEAARQEIMAQANAQANKLIEEARAAAAKVQELESQKAIATANQIIAKAREANEAELVRMKAELRREVGRLVVATSARVTGKILTPEDQQRLAEETARQVAA
jgi:F-type H+-transporting ATPase subunit b